MICIAITSYYSPPEIAPNQLSLRGGPWAAIEMSFMLPVTGSPGVPRLRPGQPSSAAGLVSCCAGGGPHRRALGAGRGFGGAGGPSPEVSGEPVPADASADHPDVLGLGSLLALRDVELHLLPILKAAVAA